MDFFRRAGAFFFIVGVCFFALCACSYIREGEVTIHLTTPSGEAPRAESTISLYGVDKNLVVQKVYFEHIPFQEHTPYKINFSGIDKIKIQIQNDSLVSVYFPVVKFFDVPALWQEQSLSVNVEMRELQAKSNSPVPVVSADENTASPAKEPPAPLQVGVSQIEDPIGTEDDFVYKKKPVFLGNKPSEKEMSESLRASHTDGALDDIAKNKDADKTISLKVQFQNTPISQAAVYMGKYASQSITFLGVTNDQGVFEVSLNPAVKPDILFLKKEGFLTQVVSIPSVFSSAPFLRVEMKGGKEHEIFLASQMYGIPRNGISVQLLKDDLKQGTSPYFGYLSWPQKEKEEKEEGAEHATDGLLVLDEEKEPEISLQIQNALPSTISEKELEHFWKSTPRVSSAKGPSLQPLFVSLREYFKPAVGLVEPMDQNIALEHSFFRRFRREFFSRFMGEIQFKSLIFSDVLNLAQWAKRSPVELAKQGWAQEPFAGMLDFLCVLSFQEEEKGAFLEMNVVDKFGQSYLSERQDLRKENPEVVAKTLFQKVQSAIPLEGYIVKKEKDLFFSNLGAQQHISPNDFFVAFVPKDKFLSASSPVAVLKAQQVDEKSSALKWEHGDRKTLENDSILVTRMSLSEIKRRFPFLF